MAKEEFTQSYVQSLLDYEHNTGVFRWKVKRRAGVRGRVFPGDIAGSVNRRGYRYIGIDGRSYRAHRLVWFWVYGKWPTNQIDHMNGNKDDNRLANLRDVDNQTNHRNQHSTRRTNKTGKTGVYLDRAKAYSRPWVAYIGIDGRTHHLGRFATRAEAIAARIAAEKELGYVSL